VKWYFDTSVLVAASVTHHPHNPRALAIVEELLNTAQKGFISAHSLAEFYSVLTRTPLRPPIYPSEAWRIIEDFVAHLDLVSLTAKEYRDVVHRCAENGWAGGKVYDAIHVRCAHKADCDRIYTFNVRDFRTLAPPGWTARIAAP
jgi:predicted nucleic acid-binding protein